MKIGIVGHGDDKFTPKSKQKACDFIRSVLSDLYEGEHHPPVLVSGHSPVGGIDIFAEEIAKEMGLPMDLKIPKQKVWDAEYGYKQRNLDIARDSDKVYVILVDKYPPGYKGMRFDKCYHCHKTDHVKSGGCWTGLQAQKLGKQVQWVIIEN